MIADDGTAGRRAEEEDTGDRLDHVPGGKHDILWGLVLFMIEEEFLRGEDVFGHLFICSNRVQRIDGRVKVGVW
jgi:hypothetical protein